MNPKLLFFVLSIALSVSVSAQKNDVEAINKVLNTYKSKIESLDTVGISNLFVSNSKIIEQAKDEGTISHYLEHYLGLN
jgi:hypothetical protein